MTTPPAPRTAAGRWTWLYDNYEAGTVFITDDPGDHQRPIIAQSFDPRVAGLICDAHNAAIEAEAAAPAGSLDVRTQALRDAYWAHREVPGRHRGECCQDPCFPDITDRWVALVTVRAALAAGSPDAPAGSLDVLRNARIIAEYWRDSFMDEDSMMRVCAHPLAMVLAALDGESDPTQMGIPPNEYERRAAPAAPGLDVATLEAVLDEVWQEKYGPRTFDGPVVIFGEIASAIADRYNARLIAAQGSDDE